MTPLKSFNHPQGLAVEHEAPCRVVLQGSTSSRPTTWSLNSPSKVTHSHGLSYVGDQFVHHQYPNTEVARTST